MAASERLLNRRIKARSKKTKMKLLKLRLKNLNSFRQEIEIDFDSPPMNETSLLAITGPTGSGKTTLFDALCVALYNKTPRLSSTGNQNPGNLLSQGKTEGFAEVSFEADGTRYLTEWYVRRNRRGELKQKAKLINAHTGALITDRLSSRSKSNDIRDMSVSDAVQTIFRLDFDAFNRSVMLAQGQFAAFLKAKAEERRTILEAATGVAIYDILKKTLNEKVTSVRREHEQVETAFNVIPVTSQKEIQQTQTQIEALEADSRARQQKRREIMRKKDEETQRGRVYQQLMKAETRQRKLRSQQLEIEGLQSELDAARRAADLGPKQETFNSEKQNLQSAELDLADAQRALNEAKSDYDENQGRFVEIETQYQAAEAERNTKMPAFDKARVEEIRAQTRFDEVERQKDELSTAEKAVHQITKDLAAQRKEKTALAGQIESDRLFLNEHPLPEDSDQRLIRAKTILVTLQGENKSHHEKSKAKRELEAKRTQLQQKSEDLAQEQTTLLDEKTTVAATVAETEAELNTLLEIGDEDTWQNQRETAQRLQPIAAQYEEAVNRLNETQQESVQVLEALNSVEAEIVDVNRALALQEKEVALAEEKVKRCETEERYAAMANQVIAMRKELQAGTPCRVCGASEHPWAGKEELEGKEQIELAQRNLVQAKATLQSQQKYISDLQREHARAEANKGDVERRIRDLRKVSEASEAVIAPAQVQWQGISTDTEISSQRAQEMTREADIHIRGLQKVKTGHTDALNQHKLIEQGLNSHEREMRSVDAQLAEIEAQQQAIARDIQSLSCEIQRTETQLWEALPNVFYGGKPAKALDQFEKQIDAVKACQKRLNEKETQSNRLSDAVAHNVRQLEPEQHRQTGIESRIVRYQAEGDRLLASARVKTGGVTVDDAIRQLEADLQHKTKQRDLAQRALHETKNRLIQFQSKLDNATSHRDAARKKFSMAQHDYSTALEDAGFASPAEHEGAFRDESWLEASETQIQQHHRDLHTAETEVATHRELFADAPFDPQEIARLRQTEQEIDNHIDSITQEIGGLREKQKKLQGDFKRQEAQALVLEKVRLEKNRWERLQKCIPDNTLRDFAVAHMFDTMIRLANKQLDDLTHRYKLKVKNMRDVVVIDKWNANEERPVETLSGGESFLTSLSLALALSEMSRGRTQLNSLFLDEGFGTLDSQTLDIAISALEGLQLAGRSIVVISHVSELTRRIPIRIAVEKMGNGSSTVKIKAPGG